MLFAVDILIFNFFAAETIVFLSFFTRSISCKRLWITRKLTFSEMIEYFDIYLIIKLHKLMQILKMELIVFSTPQLFVIVSFIANYKFFGMHILTLIFCKFFEIFIIWHIKNMFGFSISMKKRLSLGNKVKFLIHKSDWGSFLKKFLLVSNLEVKVIFTKN